MIFSCWILHHKIGASQGNVRAKQGKRGLPAVVILLPCWQLCVLRLARCTSGILATGASLGS